MKQVARMVAQPTLHDRVMVEAHAHGRDGHLVLADDAGLVLPFGLVRRGRDLDAGAQTNVRGGYELEVLEFERVDSEFGHALVITPTPAPCLGTAKNTQ
jgi:hypothetical protein